MKRFRSAKLAVIALAVVGLIAGAIAVYGNVRASEGGSENFEAQVATGVNRQLGNVLYEFDSMPPNAGFTTLGVYNPDGPDPLPLTEATSNDAVLSTYIDTEGLPAFQISDPALVNVPLRDVETWVGPSDLMHRDAVPAHLDGPVVGSTQAEPSGPITKGDWFQASGKMQVHCNRKENRVHLQAKNLIPNRIYTVWGIWLDPSVPTTIPVAVGGAPNVIMTDERGNGTFERQLNFCPMDAAEEGIDGKRLAFIDVHLHSDQIAYGTLPVPGAAGFPPGSVLHIQLTFNMGAGSPVDDGE